MLVHRRENSSSQSLVIKSIESDSNAKLTRHLPLAVYAAKMRRMNNLVTLFTAMIAFFFGALITSLLNEADKCASTHKSGVAKLEPHPEIFLMVLILSAPENEEQRQAIRETWLKTSSPMHQPYYPEDYVYIPQYDKRGHLQLETVAEQSHRLNEYLQWLEYVKGKSKDQIMPRNIMVKHFFAIGTQSMNMDLRIHMDKEYNKYKDLLLLPRLSDTYANLTEKVLHSVEALTHHYNFSYLLKTDDDTYVKMDFLLNELVSYDRKLLRRVAEYRQQPQPQLYWGYFNGRANIKSKGQWSESNYYLSQRYITYALGGGYLISRQLAEYVATNARYLTPYVSEDISMGTWLAGLRQVYRRHDARFDTGYMPRKCRPQHMVLHKRSIELMRDLYAGKLCSFEMANEPHFKRPAEYYYDWRKPADKCCDSLVV